MRKILFLDVDGVLNTLDSLNAGVDIDPEKLKLLKMIVDRTDCDIVLSSTWRLYITNLRRIAHEFRLAEIPVYISITPNLGTVERHLEIQEWIDHNGIADEDLVVVIDDDSDAKLPSALPSRVFAKTSFRTGLTPDLALTIINFFNGAKNGNVEHPHHPISLAWTVQFCADCYNHR